MIRRFVLPLLILVSISSFNQPEKTWLALGDSITYLNDHADETGHRVTKGYLTRVTEALPGYEYINQGHNGWTARQIAHDINRLGLKKADVYTVLLGTNDWWSGVRLGSFADYRNNTGDSTIYGSFRIILDKLKTLNPKATIILMTPLQRVDFVYINDMHNNAYGSYKKKKGQSLSQIADAIVRIGKSEKMPVVDLYHKSGMTLSNLVKFKMLKDAVSGEYRHYPYPSFVGRAFNPDKDEYPYPQEAIGYTFDGLHPSDKGNQVIADMLVKQFKKIK